MSDADLGALLRGLCDEALRGLDLAGRVRSALAGRQPRKILSAGKAALAMLDGALTPATEQALVIAPQGALPSYLDPRVTLLFASHPHPDESSVLAAEAALAFAQSAEELCVLVSGGCSSLLAAPRAGQSLANKRELIGSLMHGGAPIAEINVVRRHLSRIKGGGLLRVGQGPQVSLIASDVIGGMAHDIGSGPSVPDPSSVQDAERVLARYGLRAQLHETVKPLDLEARRSEVSIVVRPEDLALAAQLRLEQAGLMVFLWPATQDDVHELAKAYRGFARTLLPGQALVRVAEPVIQVNNPQGRGGRSSHLAALVGPDLPDDVSFLAAATDGVDGNSGSRGAWVTNTSLSHADVQSALRRFDTGPLLSRAGASLGDASPSGMNLCDLHVLARAPRVASA